MEKVLELVKKQCEAAEVFTVLSEGTSVQFEANRLKNIQGKQSTIVSLRVIKNGRIGYATTSGVVNEAELVEMAIETAQFGMEAKFDLPSASDYPPVKINDSAVNEITTEQMIILGEGLITPLRSNTPEIVCEGGVERGLVTVEVINSRGGSGKYSKSLFSIGIEGSVVHDTDMLFVGDSESSCRPILDTNNITETVLRQLEHAKTQATAPTKHLPVIFTPDGVASALVPSLMAAFNGKTVMEGASPIGHRLGEQVFDSEFSLQDNALIDYRPESRPWDDEGVPSQRTVLIDKGAVTNFYYDLQTAAKAGTHSTGNGSRGRGLPSPGPSTFVISPGDATFKDMVRDTQEGLVIELLMGAEQGNILGGDFSGIVLLGYKIENGGITGRVKNTMVSGNVYQILKDIKLSSEVKWVGGALQTPYIFCPSIAVASK